MHGRNCYWCDGMGDECDGHNTMELKLGSNYLAFWHCWPAGARADAKNNTTTTCKEPICFQSTF